MKYIAFLRGVNISGKNKISMSLLKKVMEENRYQDVITYINSGNIIFKSFTNDEIFMMNDIKKIIKDNFNLEIPVFVISYGALEDIVNNHPEWWDTNKEMYDNLIFIIPPKMASDVFISLGEPKSNIEKVMCYNNSIFWSYELKNYRKSTWWMMTSTVEIRNAFTIRTGNTIRKILEICQNNN